MCVFSKSTFSPIKFLYISFKSVEASTYRALARLHEAGEAFVIMPPEPVTVSNLEKDPEKLLALYEQGYRTAIETWPALSVYLDLTRAR